MPLSVAFRFLAGRYHATPFGHHVNEGLIEWPPSPWRLLRALISVGYTSGAWNGAGPSAAARSLIEKLSTELPCYHLPPAIGAHSRHYMPTGVLDGKTKIEKTTLVFDTWLRTEGQAMTITWNDVRLDETERFVLDALVQRLNYLGRSESWVEGRVMGESETVPEPNGFPERQGETPSRGWEHVALLAAMSASDFSAWRAEQLDRALADLPLLDRGKPPETLLRRRARAAEPYPTDLLDCLQKDTAWWRSHGWSQPPGSRRVFYWRPSNAVAVGTPMLNRKVESAPVAAMLLSLTHSSRNDHALPPVTRTLPQAELLHRTLVGIAARGGAPPPELTGCDENRRPLRGPHQHAHVTPLDLDGDGHLDHILIWAPMGLGPDAQAVVRSGRRTFTKGGVDPLRLALAASGDLAHLTRLPGCYGQRLSQIVAPHGARVWQSLTPFVPPRFIKRRGKNTLKEQINAELRSRGLPESVAVQQLAPVPVSLAEVRLDHSEQPAIDPVPDSPHLPWIRFRHFILSRRNGPQPPIQCGFAVRIEFEQPVQGPLALGYASHFGLGLFAKDDQ